MKLTRRDLIKTGGALSLLAGSSSLKTSLAHDVEEAPSTSFNFLGDGVVYSSKEYTSLLSKLAGEDEKIGDQFGNGGAVKSLEEAFAKITGKEKAIFMPSGTMANQLALKVSSGDASKIYCQSLSHYYRDEGDAAQRVHNKRLMPLGKGKGQFTLKELQSSIEDYRRLEYFKTEVGAISIENTCRRANEEIFDFEEIKKISGFAREHEIAMHLDGARLFMASAWSGISIREYADEFDTVYISLYKYFGAGAGGILCGPENIIGQMPDLIKIHGGNMYQNWQHAAIAFHNFNGFEARLKKAKLHAEELFKFLNKMEGLRVETFPNGSNVYKLYAEGVDKAKFLKSLDPDRNRVRGFNREGYIPIKVNETLLRWRLEDLTSLFRQALENSKNT